MMPRSARTLQAFLLPICLALSLSACGGGETGSPSSGPAPVPSDVLSWEPPTRFSDNLPLEPLEDLDRYEVYVKTTSTFTAEDLPVAEVSALDPAGAGGPEVATDFVMNHLRPFVQAGTRYYVSLRAVGIDGQKSGFMTPVAWDVL